MRWECGGFDFSFDDLVRLSGIPEYTLQLRLMTAMPVLRACTQPVLQRPKSNDRGSQRKEARLPRAEWLGALPVVNPRGFCKRDGMGKPGLAGEILSGTPSKGL